MLADKAIQQFKEIYLKHFGVELSDEEASLRANKLVNLYRTLYSKTLKPKNKHEITSTTL